MPKFAIEIKRVEKYSEIFCITAKNKTEARRKARIAFNEDQSGYILDKLTENYQETDTTFGKPTEITEKEAIRLPSMDF